MISTRQKFKVLPAWSSSGCRAVASQAHSTHRQVKGIQNVPGHTSNPAWACARRASGRLARQRTPCPAPPESAAGLQQLTADVTGGAGDQDFGLHVFLMLP